MDSLADLRVLLASQHPLLIVELKDELRFLRLLRVATSELRLPVWTWSVARGLARDNMDPQYGTTAPNTALRFVGDLDQPGVYLFSDFQPYLDDPVTARLLKEFAQGSRRRQTVIVTGTGVETPLELSSLAHRWRLRPPDETELSSLLDQAFRDLTNRGFTVIIDEEAKADLVESLSGLTLAEARGLIYQVAMAHGKLTSADLAAVRSAKAEVVNADGILEIVEPVPGGLSSIGGMADLKRWLTMRIEAASQDDAPRGILLTGIPGCGKSLVAKAVARSWDRPLVLLDPARLYSKYIGESEQRLSHALDTVDALAPAVMWVDEIEKGFSSGSTGDSGVSGRLLGTFLHWLQERTSDVFVIATANDVRRLPPEFARKGRFDEVFFVDLPDADDRREIWTTHLELRGHDLARFDVQLLAEQSEGFSGAEIEAAIVSAKYRSSEGVLDQASIAGELMTTVPLSVSRSAEVDALRAWSTTRAVAA